LAQIAAQAGNPEVLRLRKEMVQMKAALTDLQEELDEKTNLYLDAIKVSFNHNAFVLGARILFCARLYSSFYKGNSFLTDHFIVTRLV
jgi:hypothetical protein